MALDRAGSSIVDAFLKGDREAASVLESLVRESFRYWQAKFGFEKDDILSDVWFKLLKSFQAGSLRNESSLKAFVRQIVNHTCIEYYRVRKRFTEMGPEDLELPDLRPDAEHKLARCQSAQITFRVLRLMSEDCRKMWRMLLRQGLTCRQIGAELGKSEGAIKKALWTCRSAAVAARKMIQKKEERFGPSSAL